MKFQNAVIETLTHALPEERWTTAELETQLSPLYERLKLPHGRLELMTGITERRAWAPNTSPSQASAYAGENALKQSALSTQNIDLLVHSAVCRDRLEPATAAYVHGLLDLPAHTQILDVSNACLGFLNAITLAAGMVESGLIKCALVTAGENGRPLIENTINTLNNGKLSRKEIKPYFANLTVGCAAVAAIVCHRDLCEQEPRVTPLRAVIRTDSSANTLCEGDSESGNLAMQTDSEALLEAGVKLASHTWKEFTQETGWTPKTPAHTICHQVGKQHQRALYQALQLDLNKDYSTFSYLGNCGSVSLPITLSLALEKGIITTNKDIALLGIGSGLSSLMMAVRS